MNGSSHLAIEYLLMGESKNMCMRVYESNHGLGGLGYEKIIIGVCGMP